MQQVDSTSHVLTKCRVDLHTQTPDSTLGGGEEAQRSQQLRSDIVTYLRATGGGPSPWFLALVLFPELGELHAEMHT